MNDRELAQYIWDCSSRYDRELIPSTILRSDRGDNPFFMEHKNYFLNEAHVREEFERLVQIFNLSTCFLVPSGELESLHDIAKHEKFSVLFKDPDYSFSAITARFQRKADGSQHHTEEVAGHRFGAYHANKYSVTHVAAGAAMPYDGITEKNRIRQAWFWNKTFDPVNTSLLDIETGRIPLMYLMPAFQDVLAWVCSLEDGNNNAGRLRYSYKRMLNDGVLD